MSFMNTRKHSYFLSLVAIVLVFSLLMPITANAAVPDTAAPAASDYLVSYTTYICSIGSGMLQIWWRVTGTRDMENIGTLTIMLYESTDNSNWYWVDTFLHTDYPHMLSHNDSHHMSFVDYQGVTGRYYKAYVTIWSGGDTVGDARYMWTPVERAG